ncbi:hypothetical protein BVX97_01000 [bacterium E08(2017)]|nr:hypothetical protein BVX97_01000 [bacterium E08(2017)]
MNVLFFTQSRSLDVYYELYLRVKDELGIDKVGFFVANATHYDEFIATHKDFEKDFEVLKEWDINAKAKKHTADTGRIADYEKKIGDPTLWGPLVVDRRIYMGRNASFRQDYKPWDNHDQMLATMDVALMDIEKLFDSVKPDFVCTLYTATYGDCLAHMFAKERGVRSLDLRLSRLKNNVMFVDGVEEPPGHITKLLEDYADGAPLELKEQAEEVISSVRKKNAMYEGVVPAGAKKPPSDHKGLLSKIGKLIEQYKTSQEEPYCYDRQVPSVLRKALFKNLLSPLTMRLIKNEFSSVTVGETQLKELDYILYPLHVEPELVLGQFARPFLNQVEVIRNISLSMPVGMKLLIKEHPMMLGRRSAGYYRKVLEIPNTQLAAFDMPSELALEHAKLVVIIRGAIGLEAVMRQKPVVSIGQSMFELLPESMFKVCRNMYELPLAIEWMMGNYSYDHENLVRYLCAVQAGSAPVNLVTDLLGKKGRFRSGDTDDKQEFSKHPHLDILAENLIKRVSDG